jgi:predicted RNase H-like nuclease
MQVVGVDVWSRAWIAVAVDADGGVQAVRTFEALGRVAAAFPQAKVFAVDIPIGLPEAEPRTADVEARRFVGPRASSVFTTPHRAALEAESYQAALALSRERHGRGLSAQSYALSTKILETDEVAGGDDRFVEVHPEVSFRALKGQPLAFAKKTWNGQMERRRLLAESGIVIPDDLSDAGRVPPDDVLDAGAAAWSGLRIARGQASSLPDPPEMLAGRPVAIWY